MDNNKKPAKTIEKNQAIEKIKYEIGQEMGIKPKGKNKNNCKNY